MKKLNLFLILVSFSSLIYSQTTWNPQNSGTNSFLFDVHFADQYNGWACGVTGQILHTADGGINWYSQDPPPNNVYYAIHLANWFGARKKFILKTISAMASIHPISKKDCIQLL